MVARFERAREQIDRAAARPPGSADLQAESHRRGGDDRWPPKAQWRDATPELMVGAIQDSGCLWVQEFLGPDLVAALVEGIDRAFAGYDAVDAEGGITFESAADAESHDPWFSLFVPETAPMHATRPWLRAGGGLYTGDSPRLARIWFDAVRASGLLGRVARIFGERPITSLDKAALRRISPGDGIEWHQDGAFLGADSGAINVWVALTDCEDAPGLEIVPRRFDRIVETGTGGATYDWSVGPEVVAAFARETPVERPRFKAGDALVFDGMLLHRTAQDHQPVSRPRYAIETWFFRPSRFPAHQQVPLAI